MKDSSLTNEKFSVSELAQLFESVSEVLGFTINSKISPNIDWNTIDYKIQHNLYRIVQEALQNIHKYAQAKNVSIELDMVIPNQLQLSIIDDGIGFDKSLKTSGIGINNMKNRMKNIGGTFEIITAINNGTKIILIVPI